MATTNEVIGFRAFHHDSGEYLHFDSSKNENYLSAIEPEPISRSDAHRRIAAWLDQSPNNFDDFSVDPVYRELTPIETASRELGGLLESLCGRHGLQLGLTRDQINAQIAKELEQLAAGGSSFVATGIPRIR